MYNMLCVAYVKSEETRKHITGLRWRNFSFSLRSLHANNNCRAKKSKADHTTKI
jgi:predicted secreted Zn-dependent protease